MNKYAMPKASSDPDRFQGQLALQNSRLMIIKSIRSETTNSYFMETCTLPHCKNKLELLDSTWHEFEKTHVKMCEPNNFDESLLENDYFQSRPYADWKLRYATARTNLCTQRDMLEEKKLQSSQTEANLSTAVQVSPYPIILKITLPSFTGDFRLWCPFHDLFITMVVNNSNISNMVKMKYLKSSVTGEAAELIASLPMSEDSFALAWNKLVSRYENKRLLITEQLHKLYDVKPMAAGSAKGLNTLINNITEALSALIVLGAPTQYWDLLLVHFVVNQLDSGTREAWEAKIGLCMQPPAYEDLKKFLIERARVLETTQTNSSEM